MNMSTGRLEGETDWDLEYSCKAAGPDLVETNINDFPSLNHHLLKHRDGLFKCPHSGFDIPLATLG